MSFNRSEQEITVYTKKSITTTVVKPKLHVNPGCSRMVNPHSYRCHVSDLLGIGINHWCKRCTNISNLVEEHFPPNPAEMNRIAMLGRLDTHPSVLRPYPAGAPIVRILSPRQLDEGVRRRLGAGPVIRIPPYPRFAVPSTPYFGWPPSALHHGMEMPSAPSGDEPVDENGFVGRTYPEVD